MENIKEFKELIKNYDSISLYKIEGVWDRLKETHDCNISGIMVDGQDVLRIMTGYSSCSTCSLCLAINKGLTTHTDCNKCVYSLEFPEEDCEDSAPCTEHETYEAIMYSNTPKELMSAIKGRSKYMKSILIKYEKDLTKIKKP